MIECASFRFSNALVNFVNLHKITEIIGIVYNEKNQEFVIFYKIP